MAGDPPPGMLFSDAIGWYWPSCCCCSHEPAISPLLKSHREISEAWYADYRARSQARLDEVMRRKKQASNAEQQVKVQTAQGE